MLLLTAGVAGIILLGGLLLRRLLTRVGTLIASEIHLTEDRQPSWIRSPEVEDIIRDLQKLGFRKGFAYTIVEMPDVKVLGLHRPSQGMTAALYQHDFMGNWVDLVIEHTDGSAITVSNAPAGQEIDPPPNKVKIFREEASVGELYQEILNRTKSKPKRRVDQANFKDFFQEAYRKEMEWRSRRGGTTEEEVRRVAAGMSEEFDDEDIAAALKQIKADERSSRRKSP